MVNYFILKQYIVLFFFPMLALLSHMNKVLASNPPAGWGLPLCRLHVFPASSHRHTHTHTKTCTHTHTNMRTHTRTHTNMHFRHKEKGNQATLAVFGYLKLTQRDDKNESGSF